MISEDDARNTLEFEDHYVIQPQFDWWDANGHGLEDHGKETPEGFRYSSDSNDQWLTVEELRDIIRPIEKRLEDSE